MHPPEDPSHRVSPGAGGATRGASAERRHLLIAALLSIAAAVLAHTFFIPTYQTNDDPFMAWRSRGIAVCERPDPNLMFIHVFVGKALAALSTAFPGLSWYRCYMVAVQLLASTVVYGLVLRRASGARAILLCSIYMLIFDIYFYLRPQFTVTGGLAAASAFLLWTERADRGAAMTTGGLALFLALVSLAAMTRMDSARMIFALSSPCAAFLAARAAVLARCAGQGVKEASIGVARLCFPLVLALAAISSLSLVNARAYDRTAGYSDFYRYNKLSAYFLDYNNVQFNDRTRWIFDRVGWSENDYHMFRSWAFADPELFSLEKLETLVALHKSMPAAPNEVTTDAAAHPGASRLIVLLRRGLSPLRRAFGMDWGDHLRFALLLPLLLGVRSRALPLLAISIGTGLALIAYLHVGLGRCPPRVYQPIIAYLAALGLILSADGPHRESAHRFVRIGRLLGLLALAAATVPALGELRQMTNVAAQRDLAFLEALRRIDPTPNRLFIAWGSAFPFELLSLNAPMDPIREIKLYAFGGLCRVPASRARLEQFRIDDVYRAMVTRGDVAVFCTKSEADCLVQFAKEHFNLRVTYKILNIEFLSVYKFAIANK